MRKVTAASGRGVWVVVRGELRNYKRREKVIIIFHIVG